MQPIRIEQNKFTGLRYIPVTERYNTDDVCTDDSDFEISLEGYEASSDEASKDNSDCEDSVLLDQEFEYCDSDQSSTQENLDSDSGDSNVDSDSGDSNVDSDSGDSVLLDHETDHSDSNVDSDSGDLVLLDHETEHRDSD